MKNICDSPGKQPTHLFNMFAWGSAHTIRNHCHQTYSPLLFPHPFLSVLLSD
ncbi:MAG: hypothetical protein JXA00_01495 [Candidatus Thermoplasmatota archaeon]|nr:hypothetical protein [Candidatus Thermoplasmatota archaeon]